MRRLSQWEEVLAHVKKQMGSQSLQARVPTGR